MTVADTTILAATSSGCSLLDHYKTQLPYVLTVGLITPIFGHLMTGLGVKKKAGKRLKIGVSSDCGDCN